MPLFAADAMLTALDAASYMMPKSCHATGCSAFTKGTAEASVLQQAAEGQGAPLLAGQAEAFPQVCHVPLRQLLIL